MEVRRVMRCLLMSALFALGNAGAPGGPIATLTGLTNSAEHIAWQGNGNGLAATDGVAIVDWGLPGGSQRGSFVASDVGLTDGAIHSMDYGNLAADVLLCDTNTSAKLVYRGTTFSPPFESVGWATAARRGCRFAKDASCVALWSDTDMIHFAWGSPWTTTTSVNVSAFDDAEVMEINDAGTAAAFATVSGEVVGVDVANEAARMLKAGGLPVLSMQVCGPSGAADVVLVTNNGRGELYSAGFFEGARQFVPNTTPVVFASVQCGAVALATSTRVRVFSGRGTLLRDLDFTAASKTITALALSPNGNRVAIAFTTGMFSWVEVYGLPPLSDCVMDTFANLTSWTYAAGAAQEDSGAMEVNSGRVATLSLPTTMQPDEVTFRYAADHAGPRGAIKFMDGATVCAELRDTDNSLSGVSLETPSRSVLLTSATGMAMTDIEIFFDWDSKIATYDVGGTVAIEAFTCNSISEVEMGSGHLDDFLLGDCAPITPAPDTSAPATASPNTAAPATNAPDTPAPATASPNTAAPATNAPDTPAPATASPNTAAPATNAPDTPAPATVSPNTAAPATNAPDTPAPATASPNTAAPATNAPDTPAPATASPNTAAPATNAPDTLTPVTVAPPATSAPITAVPGTSAPATSAPITAVPGTSAPATSAPITAVPGTPAPATNAPITAVPTTATVSLPSASHTMTRMPAPAVLLPDPEELALFRSDNVRNGGASLTFPAGGVPFASEHRGNTVPVAVVGPGEVPPAGALIVVRVDVAGGLAEAGVATARVAEDGSGLVLTLEAGDYVLLSPNTEGLTVELSPALFPANTSSCGTGECSLRLAVLAETPHLPRHKELQAQRDVASTALATAVLAVPAGNAGPSAAILAIVSRALMCPSQEVEDLDRTLSPLGFAHGTAVYRDYSGAVVGAWAILGVLVLLCSAIATYVFCKTHGYLALDLDDNGNMARPPARRIDRRFAAIKARFGWLLMPFGFLYAGAAVGSITVLWYGDDAAVKPMAAALFLVFCTGLIVYCFYTARRATYYTAYVPVDTELSFLARVVWGTSEWVPRDDRRGSLTWCMLHHLVYDGFKPRFRYFMAAQFTTLLLLSGLTAYQPRHQDGCWVKVGGMTGALGLLALFVCLMRPYVAPYENVLEGLILLVETGMLGLTLVAMGAANPSEHWAAAVAATCATVVMWLIVAKFVMDVAVFLKDEFDLWRDQASRPGEGGVVEFIQYLICFKGTIDSQAQYRQLQYEESAKKGVVDVPGEYYAASPRGGDGDAELLYDATPSNIDSNASSEFLVIDSLSLQTPKHSALFNRGGGGHPLGLQPLQADPDPAVSNPLQNRERGRAFHLREDHNLTMTCGLPSLTSPHTTTSPHLTSKRMFPSRRRAPTVMSPARMESPVSRTKRSRSTATLRSGAI